MRSLLPCVARTLAFSLGLVVVASASAQEAVDECRDFLGT